jgi:hypothetical protein
LGYRHVGQPSKINQKRAMLPNLSGGGLVNDTDA